MDIENEIENLKQTLEKTNNTNIIVHSGEGAGNSSCTIKRTLKGESYELKVYSNDLDGANDAVQRAIAQKKELDKEIKVIE